MWPRTGRITRRCAQQGPSGPRAVPSDPVWPAGTACAEASQRVSPGTVKEEENPRKALGA